MTLKVVPSSHTAWQLLLLANTVAAAGLHPQSVLWRDSSERSLHKVASVDSKGNSLPVARHDRLTHRDNSYTKAILLEDVAAQVVRREDGTQAPGKVAQPTVQTSEEKLLEIQATSGSAKIVILFLLVTAALVSFCGGAVYLVWSPISAMLEERAFEQAARKAFLNALPPPPVPQEAAEGTASASAPLFASVASEDRLQRQKDKLSSAWTAFLKDPVLQVESTNVLYVTMETLFDRVQQKQFDDLFDEAHAANPDGAPLTDIDHLTKQDFERVLESIDGSVSGMAITAGSRSFGPRMSSVRPFVGAHSAFAVTSTEDYAWLFDAWDQVFSEREPMTKECFPGVLKLVLAWNFVRTLHTSRNMSQEARLDAYNAGASDSSGQPTMQFTINMKMGKPPLEVKAEVEYTEVEEVPKKEEEEKKEEPSKKPDEDEVVALAAPPQFEGETAPEASLAGSTANQSRQSSNSFEGASETMKEKLARKSKAVEEVKMDEDEDGKADGEPSP